ncbi:MAG TPA: purine-binding chemotaxis protein CheW [Phycisphaerae bacterium]|nr:purine-binding chemotaxis protein CheW [Phycisphaerae bacterium]
MATQTAESSSTAGGLYLTFALADEEYGLEILKVREIISLCEITSVPKTPDYIKGVINLRGKIIPVVDLRMKFQMPAVQSTNETCIIVVSIGPLETGIMVDRVSEVMEIDSPDIEITPQFGNSVNTNFILGMGKVGEKVTILLDIAKVLSNSDSVVMQSLTQTDK